MDYKATLMVLVLVSSALAGCTGDPDGGGGDEVDSDALQDLFDEHFQDFLNNTTITVINNYHNNTTYVVDDGDYSSTTNVEYNNTTINEGDESSTNNYNNQTDNDYSLTNYSLGGSVVGVNGTTGGIMYMIDMTFTIDELIPQPEPAPDYRNNTINYDQLTKPSLGVLRTGSSNWNWLARDGEEDETCICYPTGEPGLRVPRGIQEQELENQNSSQYLVNLQQHRL